jgi:RNA polymerase sigma-70 factor (ECF subfamily)
MNTLARSMLRDAAEADDVVEEALLRIHRAAPDFRGERGLRTWSLRIVANLCRDHLRRRKFSAGPPEDLPPLQQLGLSINPVTDWDGAMDQKVLAEAVERAIGTLAADHREAVVMRYRLGLSEAEMSEALGVPAGTVKSRLSRAMVLLRDALKELGS